MPKVSVLMPVYKTDEKYLREAIESILTQTFSDFEFLILDDCPEDSREAVVLSYDDKRIKYYKNERNMGITPSRNKLIEMAKGEYLAVFDHDDISLPERFEKEVAYLDEHPEVGVISCWVDCFPIKNELHFPSEDIEIKKLLMEICSLVHPASMIRKSVLIENNIRYEERFSPAEDYALWLRLIEFTQFYNIPEVLYNYRLHEENTSKIQQRKMQEATNQLHIFAQNKYPVFYQNYQENRMEIVHIKLFHVIPFLKIKRRSRKGKVYLFNFIPLISYQRKKCIWPK